MRLFRRSKKQTRPTDAPQRRVLFVSHEASRTGAPKIILNLLKHFREHADVCCETILHTGGCLAPEFHQHSHLTDCLDQPPKATDKLKRRVRRIVQRESNNLPILALCNSMESRHIGEELAKYNIPVISLVHELPSSYTPAAYQSVVDFSQKVVFPVDEVFQATSKDVRIPNCKSLVLPQGLLEPEFGTGIARERACREIREELSLPENSFIVLGCGSLDLRKGIDHFAAVARRVTETNLRSETPIHFVWVGDGPRWTHSPFHYVQLDMANSPARPFVHFIGERKNVEPWFMGSDAFFMSSRVDPFPCVIHEAMAAGLPVITFADSGGAQSAVSDGAGFVIPYADHEHATMLIRTLAAHPHIASSARDRSQQRVQEDYRFEDYANKMIDLSESVTGQELRHQPAAAKLKIAA